MRFSRINLLLFEQTNPKDTFLHTRYMFCNIIGTKKCPFCFNKVYSNNVELGLWYLTPLSTIFQLYRGRDRMVDRSTTSYAISAYHHWSCEFESHPGGVYSIQHYVIKFVGDLQQVGGFLLVFRLPPPIKLTATI